MHSIDLKFSCVSPEEYWCRFGNNSVMPVAKLCRMYLFEGIIYPENKKVHEDTFTTYKLMFQQEKIASGEARLYYYYFNPNSLTASVWAPDKIVVLDALEEQIAFLRQNGYHSACTPIIQFLFWSANKQVMLIRGLSPKYDQYLKDMKTRRKQAFHMYLQEVGFCNAVSYWFEIRFLEPAKRILHKESIFSFLKRKWKKVFSQH